MWFLNWISPMTKDTEHLYMWYYLISMYTWWNICSNLSPFKKNTELFSWISVSFGYKSFIRHILCINFLQSVPCLFILFIVSFVEQKYVYFWHYKYGNVGSVFFLFESCGFCDFLTNRIWQKWCIEILWLDHKKKWNVFLDFLKHLFWGKPEAF